MGHHIVDRNAGFGGETVVPFRKLLATQLGDVSGNKVIDFPGGDPRLDQFGHLAVAVRNDLARRLHLFDFPR
ncbi:hypothetical protein D3C74_300330 [compost metagenome]